MKQKLLIFGGAGLVGSKFISQFKHKYEITAPEIDDLDILNKDALFNFIESQAAEIVINYAAFTNVDKAEEESGNKNGLAYRLNALAVRDLCEICQETNKHLIHYSTDYVFDGAKSNAPYTEDDKASPINWYGETKYLGEKFILESNVRATIIRISMPFSSKYDLKQDIVRFFLSELMLGREIVATDDQIVTPVLVDEAANALEKIIESQATGIFHTVSSSSTTPFDLAKLMADKFGFDKNLVTPIKLTGYNKTRIAKRLQYGWLDIEKFEKKFGKGILHNIEQGLDKFSRQIV